MKKVLMKIEIDNLSEVIQLIESVDKHRVGAILLVMAAVVLVTLIGAGMWLLKH